MKTILFALSCATVLVLSRESAGVNYMFLTDSECMQSLHPEPNESCSGDCFASLRDTIYGTYRTNDSLCSLFRCNQWPVFMSTVISAQDNSCPDSPGFDEAFQGGAPILGAARVVFPDTLRYLREATDGWSHFDEPGMQWRCIFNEYVVRIYTWPEGIPLSSRIQPMTIPAEFLGPVTFFHGPLEIAGEFDPEGPSLIIGCSRDIRLIDNLMIRGTDTSTGMLPAGATSRIALASERNIIVSNTWENGRANHSGPPPNNQDICITALLCAVGGSFTFEQQNDPQDTYNCSCSPDTRGNIVLTGAIAQRKRGYMIRSNLGGTGYNQLYHFDERLRNWSVGVFEPLVVQSIPDTFDFSDCPVGTATWDTILVIGEGPFSGATASFPFFTNAGYEFNGPTHLVPVRFIPPSVGPYYGLLMFFLNAQFHSIVLRGNGVTSGGPQIISTDIVPNPFNVESRIQLELAGAGHLRAIVFDILGREVARLADADFAAGRHTLRFDGSSLASGVYFLNLQTPQSVMTRKLLLLK